MQDNAITVDSILNQYFKALDENDLKKEKNKVIELVSYIAEMENRFDLLLSEMKELRTTLTQLQTPQATNINTGLHGVETALKKGQGKIVEMKQYMKDTIHQAMENFQKHGVDALVISTQTLKVKPILESVRRGLLFVSEKLDTGILRTNQLANECRKATHSVKNIGLLLTGRNPRSLKRNAPKLNFLQRTFYSSKQKVMRMDQTTVSMLQKLTQMEKTSVKGDLKKQKQEKKVSKEHQVNMVR